MKVLQNYSPKLISTFGNRTYWINGEQVTDYHIGIDIVADIDGVSGFDHILAVSNGKVELVVNDIPGYVDGGSYGNQIVINHENGYKTRYAHLKQNSVPLNVGDSVNKGQVIGYMGMTGNITAGHLHFEIIKDNIEIDPYDYIFNNKKFESENTNTPIEEPNDNDQGEEEVPSTDSRNNFWINLFKKIKEFFDRIFSKK